MDFHLPKPLHGWRAFAGEVGVIVLGVLIALAAQEVAQSIGARRDAAELRQSMVDELATDRARWEANNRDVPCALRQLDDMRLWARRPGSGALERFDAPALWTMHDSAWQMARSSPAMTALPLKDRDAFASLYFTIGIQERILEMAQNSLNRVEALAKSADLPASREALPEAVAETRKMLKLINGNFYPESFDELGIRRNMHEPYEVNYKSGCPPITRAPEANGNP